MFTAKDFHKMLLGLVIALFAGMVLSYVGNGDYKEAQRQKAEYCDNVKNDVWPDFRKNYSKICK